MAGDLDLDALERLATDEDRDREELETVADAFPRVLSRLRAAEARGAAKALEWSEDDRPLPEDAEIKAAHPMRTGRHDLYGEAMRLVGARYSKGALVDLVVWLLHRADAAEARGRERGVADGIDACEREAGSLPRHFEHARIGVEACIKRLRALIRSGR